jgi:SAM-dependent methyltransferase
MDSIAGDAQMTTATADPFAKFKAAQREAWSVFAPVEIATTIPAAKLVKFAQIASGQKVLDLACGTGVVAVTAALRGAQVCGLDLSPVLLERAHHNAATAGVDIDFIEGDAEALPYPDASFDVVLSQFGHIFTPRPAVVVKEMLRVLKRGGRIAFSTWPPDSFPGRGFGFIARQVPRAPGAEPPAPPPQWGDPNIISERLGAAVTDLTFDRATLTMPSLSPRHFRAAQEKTIGPLTKLVDSLQNDPAKLAQVRAEFDAMARDVLDGNAAHLHFLMARATKA